MNIFNFRNKKKHEIKKKQILIKNKQQLFIDRLKFIIDNVDASYDNFDQEIFKSRFLDILEDYNCSFGYQNKNSKKHGHVKVKINRITGERKLELKIEENENLAGNVYTIIHELTHLVNNHLESKHLTYKQKEVVADTVGKMFIRYFGMDYEFLRSNLAKKWNVLTYSDIYVKNMAFSKIREEKMIEEIEKTFKSLKKRIT